MTRTRLLTVTALVEFGAGVGLLTTPTVFLSLLLGVERASPEAHLIARVAGAALLALAVACWLARKDASSRAATGLIAAMLLYNIAVAALVAFVAYSSGLVGIALWPAVVLHTAMAGWCLNGLRGRFGELS